MQDPNAQYTPVNLTWTPPDERIVAMPRQGRQAAAGGEP
jgi:hypothetical protein